MHTRRLSYGDLLQEEWARNLREFNQCHNPAGSSGGGQFCSKGGGTSSTGSKDAPKGGSSGGGGGGTKPTGRAALSPAGKAAVDRFHTMGIFRSPDDNPYSAEPPLAPWGESYMIDKRYHAGRPHVTPKVSIDPKTGALVPKSRDVATPVPHDPAFHRGPATAPKAAAGPVPGSVRVKAPPKPKVEYVPPGGANPHHIANYRGMEIHTLPGYTTPYYFVNAPGFGSFEHTASFTRIKRQIDTFKTTGVTSTRARKEKASARYQKRKARGY